MLEYLKKLQKIFLSNKIEDIYCPICGYYCLGKGGLGCIDKPNIYFEVKLNNK